MNAKDKLHYIFQRIFYDIFYENIHNELLCILQNKQYDYVILSPYHKRRLFHGYWHPNMFFEKIFQEIKKKYHFEYEIIVPHYTSSVAANVFLGKNVIFSKDQQAYLLCDDVLTTGKSALNAQNKIQQYLNISKAEPRIFWDLFNIFRSPQK